MAELELIQGTHRDSHSSFPQDCKGMDEAHRQYTSIYIFTPVPFLGRLSKQPHYIYAYPSLLLVRHQTF